MVTGLAWVGPTVPVTLAILDRTALRPTPPTLTSSRRTLKVDECRHSTSLLFPAAGYWDLQRDKARLIDMDRYDLSFCARVWMKA